MVRRDPCRKPDYPCPPEYDDCMEHDMMRMMGEMMHMCEDMHKMMRRCMRMMEDMMGMMGRRPC